MLINFENLARAVSYSAQEKSGRRSQNYNAEIKNYRLIIKCL